MTLGVQLGGDMPPPNFANPTGYWEDTGVHHLNVEALNALGTTWANLSPIADDDVDKLADLGFLDAAHGLLTEKLRQAGIFAVKNPRMLRLWPFWQRVFAAQGCAVDIVWPIRNPLDVAQSLARRDGMPIQHGYLLWLTHMLSAAQIIPDHRRIVLEYDRLVLAPELELDRLAAALGLQVDAVERTRFLTGVLDPDLRHGQCTAEDLHRDAECPVLVREMYLHLAGVASDEWPLDPDLVRAWAVEMDRLTPVLKHIDNLNSALDRAPKVFSLRRSIYRCGRATLHRLPILRALPFRLSERISHILRD